MSQPANALVNAVMQARPTRAGEGGAPVARVLIVEDERIVAADLQRLLRELGYDAYATAASCSKALALAEDRPPEVVLADIRIEGSVDGIDTAIRLREQCGSAVVFLTAHTDDATVARARSAEPAGYLTKPVSAPAVKIAIEQALERRMREASMRAREQALTDYSLDLLSALNHLPVGVQLEDAGRRLVHVNGAFGSMFDLAEDPATLTGYDGVEFMERVVQPLCLDSKRFAMLTDCLRQAQELTAGDVISLQDGRKLEVGYAPIERGGMRRGQLWMFRDISESERERQDLVRSAAGYRKETLVDPLTGLTSRRGFFQLAPTFLQYVRCRKEQRRVLFYVDLDGLKTINDRHGHAAGDEAICAAARALRESFGVSDLLARLGGDEFVVLATILPADVERTTARLAARLDEFNRTVAPPYELAVSVGTAEYSAGESLDGLVSRADEAMYCHKSSKRTRESPRDPHA